MQVDEIKVRQKLMEEMQDSTNAQVAGNAAQFGICFWLSELCLQQAEASEHLAKIANPLMVVNAESSWAMFSDGKSLVAIDRREVIGVRRSGPRSEMMSQVDTRTGLYIVQGTVVEVCTKLGIPVA